MTAHCDKHPRINWDCYDCVLAERASNLQIAYPAITHDEALSIANDPVKWPAALAGTLDPTAEA